MCDRFIKMIETQTFVDCHELYKRVVMPLNDLFGAETFMIVVGDTSHTYLRVECRVQYCFYCQWFKFKEWRGKQPKFIQLSPSVVSQDGGFEKTQSVCNANHLV